MTRITTLFFFLFTTLALQGQIRIEGQVLNSTDQKPVAHATVYINNTTQKTQTDSKGDFQLHTAQGKQIELVVSRVGFETLTTELFTEKNIKQNFQLREKYNEIEGIVVTAYDKDGWSRWGKYFTETFIGTGENATDAEIINSSDLRFRYDDKEKILYVRAAAPIEIRNPALGYRIIYDLKAFNSYFSDNMIQFEGSMFFEEVKNSRKVRENRKLAYQNSMMRFVRSTYYQTWEADGYKVRELKKVLNQEKATADSTLQLLLNRVYTDYGNDWRLFYASQSDYTAESVHRIREQTRGEKYLNLLGGLLKESAIIRQSEAVTKRIAYDNYIFVTYDQMPIEPSYFTRNFNAVAYTKLNIDQIEEILIDETGNYYPGTHWMIDGFWAWFNKVSNALPLDYKE